MKQLIIILGVCTSLVHLKAQTLDIPDAVFLDKLIEAGVDLNSNGTIQLNEALATKELNVSKTDTLFNISSLSGIEHFANLEVFECEGHFLLTDKISFPGNSKLVKLFIANCGGSEKTIDLTANPELEELDVSEGNFQSINVSSNAKLRNFVCHTNGLDNLDVSGNPNLLNLYCQENRLSVLDLSQNPLLRNFNCAMNELPDLDVSKNRQLLSLICPQNSLRTLDLSKNDSLKSLYCYYNRLSELDLSKNVNLSKLWCTNNRISELDFKNNPKLIWIFCNRNNLSELSISHLENLQRLSCGINNRSFREIDISQCLELEYLHVTSLILDSLDVSKHLKLENLNCAGTNLDSLNLTNNSQLVHLDCSGNSLRDLDLSANLFLETIACQNNALESFDIRPNPFVSNLNVSYNYNLKTLYLKNGSLQDINIIRNRELEYICTDDFEIEYAEYAVDSFNLSGILVDSECPSDIPEGFYQVIGRANIEYENLKCEDREKVVEIKYNIVNDTFRETPLASFNGIYRATLKEGNYTIKPHVINSPYFKVEPDSINISFPADGEVVTTQFCVRPELIVQDLNIALYNTNRPRPGEIGNYKIKITNNGTTVESGRVEFGFNDGRVSMLTQDPPSEETYAYGAMWEFEDLAPFESRTYCFSMQLNGPQSEPPLNGRDVLKYYATISPLDSDYRSADNSVSLCQEIRNSYDPNDKTCMQGAAIFEERIGEYVFYRIRFENTGTADALNIRIKDEIDVEKYAISTLQIVESSHKMSTKISQDNIIEFFFKDINLSFEEGNNTGYVVFKLRIHDTLVVGDSFANSAEIYFDNNLPIITNTASTLIISPPVEIELGDKKFLLNIYPNPSPGVLNITSSEDIQELYIYDVRGRIVYRANYVGAEVSEVQTPLLDSGLYMVQAVTAVGMEVAKVVVEQ